MQVLEYVTVDSWAVTWIVLPVLIFLARIFDQSIGTLRMIFVGKGLKTLVPVLAFFESLTWLLAIGQIMQHLDNWICYLAYAGGYAMGNWVGMILDERISLGNVIIRIIVKKGAVELVEYLRKHNFGLTVLDAEGATGPVKVLFSIVKRKDAPTVISIINEFDPLSFYTIEEVRSVNEGVFRTNRRRRLLDFHMGARKAK
jgi:uncharacterized protein YebE (UPF0316 family)